MSVHRIHIERKKGFRQDAANLLAELKNFLNIDGISDLRILHRYDVEGTDAETFNRSVDDILSTPSYETSLKTLPQADYLIPIELLPGQFDQRADSCAHNIRIINGGKLPSVKYAKIILLYGGLKHGELEKIEGHLINPVESRKASLKLPKSLAAEDAKPNPVPVIHGFLELNEERCHEFLKVHNLAMDSSDLLFCRDYFRQEGRNPTLTELKMIDTYWSDHCRHTTFLTEIDSAHIEDPEVKAAYENYQKMRKVLGHQDKPVTLMDLATIGAGYLKHTGMLTDLDESPEINACSVKINVDVDGKPEPWLLMFKNETHNHPTEIEPFGGAATCLGGAIRDPLSGRAYVYQAMRITGAYNPLLSFDETLPGKLPQRTIAKEAAGGYSSYGNQIGVSAGLVKEIYHPGYLAKRMEMGAVIAAAPEDQVVREEPQDGDVVILLGGRTGRDGLGGATGSSKSHDISSLEKSGPQVQKGNAPEERKIQRLFRNQKLAKLIKRCNDFGAGGVAVAVGELADSLHINLDAVPLKYPGLDGTEIAISESQERMAVVVDSKNLETFLEYSKEENLEATLIAKVTSKGRLVMSFMGEEIVDLSREFLNSNGTTKHAELKVPILPQPFAHFRHTDFKHSLGSLSPDENFEHLNSGFEKLATDLNHCSQKGLSQMFDSTVGCNTILAPYGGYYEETPIQTMVAKIPVLQGETTSCSLASYGFDPYISCENPFRGAYLAVIHSVGKLLAAGADVEKCWLSFQEYFEKLGNDPVKWGKPFSALLGALKAQMDLGIAAIGGKDSMSGSFEDLHVPPTLISLAVALGDATNIISPEFKGPGNPVIYMAGEGKNILDFYKKIRELISKKKVLSAYAISGRGIAEALFEMSLGNKIGVNLQEDFPTDNFFRADYGAFILELNPLQFTAEKDYPGVLLGHTVENFALTKKAQTIDFVPIRNLYMNKLNDIYPQQHKFVKKHTAGFNLEKDGKKPKAKKPEITARSTQSLGIPSFLIPLLPGNQGEYELAEKIREAGGKAEIFVFKNTDGRAIEESLAQLSSKIKKSQALVFPDGMPFGNEPGGGGKYLAEILKREPIAENLDDLINHRKGLILGLGSGFQSLMRVDLLPRGHMLPASGHFSGFADIEICSTDSPWFWGFEIGDIHKLPLSLGENAPCFDGLTVNIAAKFLSGEIEAVSSPCGRVLGRIGCFERTAPYLYQNIFGPSQVNLFVGALNYFA